MHVIALIDAHSSSSTPSIVLIVELDTIDQ
jgi:hypothetical protein